MSPRFEAFWVQLDITSGLQSIFIDHRTFDSVDPKKDKVQMR